MIGLVIVTHGNVGSAMLETLHHVVGQQPHAQAIGIHADDDLDRSRDQILKAVKEVNVGKGVIILTDMFGGTPSNLAIAAMPLTQSVVLAGVNVPMLVKLATARTTLPLLDAAREAEMAGRKYIQLVSETLAPTGTA